MKKVWLLNLFWPLTLAGVVIWMLFTRDMAAAAATLARSDWPYAALAFGVNLFLLYFRVFTWSVILKPVWSRFSYHSLCLPAFTAYLINSIFPGRFGGLIQAWLAGRRTGMGLGRAFGSVFMIRIMDAATLVPFGVLVFSRVPGNLPAAGAVPAVALIGFAAAALASAAWLTVRRPAWQEWIKSRLLSLVPEKLKASGHDTLSGFVSGVALLNHPGRLLAVLGLSACFWGIAGISVFCLLRAFHPDLALLSRAYVLLTAQVFAMAVPAPGNVGPYHGATMAVLVYYGVPVDRALMTAVAMHGVMTLGNSLPGLVYLLADRTPVREVYRQMRGGVPLD